MPLVVPESTSIHISAKPRLLMCAPTDDPNALPDIVRAQGHNVVVAKVSCPISTALRTLLFSADMVLLDVTMSSRDVLSLIDALNASIGICSVRPRLLCFSTAHRNPDFVMALEKYGARYTRVTTPSLLAEAINLLFAEMNDLQRNGPCFQIVHSFSQGSCAPGEAIFAALLVHHGRFLQLPLALAERLVFEFLAQHRRIAMDSSQIVSGLSGGWFYRDHAANSGHKQVKRIRRASVKVLVQRIREAMASTFAKAGLRFDPRDILCSCPAEGTNKVLYKLFADVRWHHVGEHFR
jgi:hypothetical protein